MGDKHNGNAELAVYTQKQAEHLVGGLRVECTCCLVGKQNFWLKRKRTGNTHTLLLAARELVGVAVCKIGKPYVGEQRINTLLTKIFSPIVLDERVLNILRHRFG